MQNEHIKNVYTKAAEGFGCGCGCGDSFDSAVKLGYNKDEIVFLPQGANLGLGCGNPISFANLKLGETVVDLGSGAGIDCFLAAREVGENGFVYGIDIEKETAGESYLSKSGCYEAKILELEHKKTTNGYGQVVLKLEVEGKETTIYHIYEGKDGAIGFKVRILNHLLYLNKLTNPADISKCVGKSIGVMLKAKLSQDKKYINLI